MASVPLGFRGGKFILVSKTVLDLLILAENLDEIQMWQAPVMRRPQLKNMRSPQLGWANKMMVINLQPAIAGMLAQAGGCARTFSGS